MTSKKKTKLKPGQILIQFTKGYGRYNAGETAAFPTLRARELIEAGVAAQPGVIAKAAAVAKSVADAKKVKRPPEVGKRATFLVPGLGEQEGVITEVAPGGSIKVRVGTEDLFDLYDVEEGELTVLG